jgi:Tfp pilus assembly protein PilV
MARIRSDDGLGLVELLIALFILNVALLALVAGFTSGMFAVSRASRVATGGVLADSQMERYRGMTYGWIGLDTNQATDATYTSDTACVGDSTCENTAPALGASACAPGGAVWAVAAYQPNCTPSASVTGADGRTYRVDTYVRTIQSVQVGNPRATKIVTVVVRDPATGNRVLAREESDFESCTALPDPSLSGAGCG